LLQNHCKLLHEISRNFQGNNIYNLRNLEKFWWQKWEILILKMEALSCVFILCLWFCIIFLYRFQLFVQVCARKCSTIPTECFLKVFYEHSTSYFWENGYILCLLNKWILSHHTDENAEAVGIVHELNTLVSIWFDRLFKLFDINRHIRVYIGEIQCTCLGHGNESL
jgi:hypothetical protein